MWNPLRKVFFVNEIKWRGVYARLSCGWTIFNEYRILRCVYGAKKVCMKQGSEFVWKHWIPLLYWKSTLWIVWDIGKRGCQGRVEFWVNDNSQLLIHSIALWSWCIEFVLLLGIAITTLAHLGKTMHVSHTENRIWKRYRIVYENTHSVYKNTTKEGFLQRTHPLFQIWQADGVNPLCFDSNKHMNDIEQGQNTLRCSEQC